jgi:hypothetical protein
MNPRSELKALKDWKDLELNSLTLTLRFLAVFGGIGTGVG